MYMLLHKNSFFWVRGSVDKYQPQKFIINPKIPSVLPVFSTFRYIIPVEKTRHQQKMILVKIDSFCIAVLPTVESLSLT